MIDGASGAQFLMRSGLLGEDKRWGKQIRESNKRSNIPVFIVFWYLNRPSKTISWGSIGRCWYTHCLFLYSESITSFCWNIFPPFHKQLLIFTNCQCFCYCIQLDWDRGRKIWRMKNIKDLCQPIGAEVYKRKPNWQIPSKCIQLTMADLQSTMDLTYDNLL